MKILALRFKKDELIIAVCNISEEIFNVINLEKRIFRSAKTGGERLNNVRDEIQLLVSKYQPDSIVFRSADFSRFSPKDEIRLKNEAILEEYCFSNNIILKELNKRIVRKELSFKKKELTKKETEAKSYILKNTKITKSNIILEFLILLYLTEQRRGD